MGDGELNEGNIWEAAMFASKYQLGRLIGIIDRNNIQISGTTDQVMPLGIFAVNGRALVGMFRRSMATMSEVSSGLAAWLGLSLIDQA